MGEEDREALILLAYLFMQHGRPDKAVILLLALDEAFPRDRYVPRLLAHCLLHQKKPQEALPFAEKLLVLPDLSEEEQRLAALLHAETLWQIGQREPEAQSRWRGVLEQSLETYLRLTEARKTAG